MSPILLLSAGMLGLLSCSNPAGGSTSNTSRDWTILLYVDADNDLELYGIRDVNEAEYGMYLASLADPQFSEKVSVVALIDRTNETGGATYTDEPTETDGEDWTGARYYEITPDSAKDGWGAWEYGDFTSSVVQNPGEVNMGDVETLRDFIEFGKINYPAKHYALIIWNHGGGVRDVPANAGVSAAAVAYDESSGDDALWTREISDGLDETHSVDVLGMDACLMGLVETAYQYRAGVPGQFHADYYVASPHTEPGDGWEYHRILVQVAETLGSGDATEITGANLGSILVDAYASSYTNTNNDAVLTSIDTSRLTEVKEAVDALSVAIAGDREKVEAIRGCYAGTESIAETLNYFNETLLEDWIGSPHVDLYDLASRIGAAGTEFPAQIRAAAAELANATEAAVLSSWADPGFSGFEQGRNGLAIFFPDGDGDNSPQTWRLYSFYSPFDLGDSGSLYGGLTFLAGGSENGTVETWYEMLEWWYDAENEWTTASY